MSDATKQALTEAIAAHIADVTDGNLLTDWALAIASTELEDIGTGRTNYYYEGNDNQPAHVGYGLLKYTLDASLWQGTDDDDDE